MSEDFSYILVCPDIEKALEKTIEKYEGKRVCAFSPEKDEFLLEDAKKVVKEAYIAEDSQKIIILCANGYRIEAQNSLLKILEEPPKNIKFILIVPTKTIFLPTIRSRLNLEELKIQKEIYHSGLDFSCIDEKEIYEFVQANSRVSKIELKKIIQAIVSEAILKYRLSFSDKELSHFQTLLELANLNSRPQNILFSLLISIMKRKRA